MTYTPITAPEIATGEPVKQTVQAKIKDNFESHEARITSLEGGGNTVYTPIIFRINGEYSNLIAPQILKTTLNFNLTITGVRLLIDTAGTSGTTQIDIKYKRGGAYTTILSTKPSVSYSSGNDSISNNAVLDLSQVNLLAGDILAMDIVSTQLNAKNFLVRIDFNKT